MHPPPPLSWTQTVRKRSKEKNKIQQKGTRQKMKTETKTKTQTIKRSTETYSGRKKKSDSNTHIHTHQHRYTDTTGTPPSRILTSAIPALLSCPICPFTLLFYALHPTCPFTRVAWFFRTRSTPKTKLPGVPPSPPRKMLVTLEKKTGVLRTTAVLLSYSSH